MQEPKKLVVVTRNDLSEGQRAVQATHAAIDFTFEHPGRAGPWHTSSNYLVLLSVNNEAQLKLLLRKIAEKGLVCTIFREPDLDNQITAVAIEPSPITQKLVSKIPLLFKSQKNYHEQHSI